ncbi:rhodanese-like domain-containing protein [Carboxylicivirga sp. N1Y90]|uniref:rhodanese-like domain-containing protein n=1 Tax=Carboxylicivirga fragile TaxID=3417571 RepID=UPI003D334A7E|nr:rhodanese-like domain-containing protein [Marinilabiliaceae bacterium N1Y90]
MGLFSNLFGKRKRIILEALERDAKIIDVRTPQEFRMGNVDGSVNIPLDKLNSTTIKKIKKLNRPVLLCCASGTRSASAMYTLRSSGVDDVHNGGSWHKVFRVMQSA